MKMDGDGGNDPENEDAKWRKDMMADWCLREPFVGPLSLHLGGMFTRFENILN